MVKHVPFKYFYSGSSPEGPKPIIYMRLNLRQIILKYNTSQKQ